MFGSSSLLDQFASVSAFLATAIVLGGFVTHAGPALQGASDPDVRRATVKGGMYGLGGGCLVIVLSAFFDNLFP
jgi:hypothetical protein